MKVLDDTELREETIVIFTSDHGEMLGERGMWYKRTFYERSSKVPLIINGTGLASKRVDVPVSLLDLYPTILGLAGSSCDFDLPGQSLLSVEEQPVFAEYLGEGVEQPCRMLRMGPWKYIYVHRHPDQLFNIVEDPLELTNRAQRPDAEHILRECRRQVLTGWNPEEERKRVLASQERRRLLQQALRQGHHTPWDYQPETGEMYRYVREADAQESSTRQRL